MMVFIFRRLHRFGRLLGHVCPLDLRTYKLLLAEIHRSRDVIGSSTLQVDVRSPKLLEDPRDGSHESCFDCDSSGHRFVFTKSTKLLLNTTNSISLNNEILL